MSAVSSEAVADEVRAIDASETLPAHVAADPAAFARRLYEAWADNGGHLDGKRRNSVRQLTELLGEARQVIPSITPKLAGRTRIGRDDAALLIELFLTCWSYRGEPALKAAKRADYAPFDGIDIAQVTRRLLGSLFPSAEQKIQLPSLAEAQSATANGRKSARGIIRENYPDSDAWITVSLRQTFFRRGAETVTNFRGLIDEWWQQEQQEQIDRLLIWIVGVSSRRWDDERAALALLNLDALATQFHALKMFGEDELDAERWQWISDHAAIVVGGLFQPEIDGLYQGADPAIAQPSTRWPNISAADLLLHTHIPARWQQSGVLERLYGLNVPMARTHSVFYRARAWPSHSTGAPDLRYFGYAPLPDSDTSTPHVGGTAPAAWGLELGSPGEDCDHAFRMVYAAACYQLGRQPPQGGIRSPPNALAALTHLRHLGFAVLRLQQFLQIFSQLGRP